MEAESGVLQEPAVCGRGLVGGDVVEHDGHGEVSKEVVVDGVEEADELCGPVPGRPKSWWSGARWRGRRRRGVQPRSPPVLWRCRAARRARRRTRRTPSRWASSALRSFRDRVPMACSAIAPCHISQASAIVPSEVVEGEAQGLEAVEQAGAGGRYGDAERRDNLGGGEARGRSGPRRGGGPRSSGAALLPRATTIDKRRSARR